MNDHEPFVKMGVVRGSVFHLISKPGPILDHTPFGGSSITFFDLLQSGPYNPTG